MKPDWSHINSLKSSYLKVGKKIIEKKDFDIVDLEKSRRLFTAESLINRRPVPINVEVYAVLSGISFNANFLALMKVIHEKLHTVLEDALYYFVKPENLGVEFAVLKWPDDDYDESVVVSAIKVLESSKIKTFIHKIFGIQLHTDGTILFKGIDQNCTILNLRERLVNQISGIPKRQSEWAHIPLGRILSPIGKNKMKELKQVIEEIDNEIMFDIIVDAIHLVHEKQWYMEQKNYIYTKRLF